MPYIGNVLTSFAVETGNINDQAVTAPKLSATGGTDGQILALDSNLNLEWVSDPAGQWITNGTTIYYDAGNVGINTGDSPSAKFQVDGADILIHGVSIGRGAGDVGSNTVVGNNALDANTTGSNSTAIGDEALTANTQRTASS